MALRFANSGSDFARILTSYQAVHRAVEPGQTFDVDFIASTLAQAQAMSSSGAVGTAALARSYNVDRSRDGIYNNAKMYSEVWRYLGWLRPAGKRLEFQTTFLGDDIASLKETDPDLKGVLEDNLFGIVFPNPNTHNKGIVNNRPFRLLLPLMHERLDDVITRHEMILGLLAVTDDRQPGAFDDAADRILAVRGGDRQDLLDAVDTYASQEGVTRTTLENYTRFPVGVLKSPRLGWADTGRERGLYSKPCEALRLTDDGCAAAQRVSSMLDVRSADLAAAPISEQAAFANATYYQMLLRNGWPEKETRPLFDASWQACGSLQTLLGEADYLYSPFQQASDEVLMQAGAS